MTTYVYETVPAKPGGKTKRYEIRQSMKDAALTTHPETGEPIRRIVSGGYGFVKTGSPASVPQSASSCCHAGGCGCH